MGSKYIIKTLNKKLKLLRVENRDWSTASPNSCIFTNNLDQI